MKDEAYARLFADKPKEKLISRLCTDKKQITSLSKHLSNMELNLKRAETDRAKARFERNTIEEANRNLAELLFKYGARPKHLLVTYLRKDCKRCKWSTHYDTMIDDNPYVCECEDNWYESECEWETVTETLAFYDFEISGETLTGILGSFADVEYDVIRVEDMDTGKVLYENKEQEAEDGQG